MVESEVEVRRGRFPVGVATVALGHPADPARRLTVEVWYPAAEAHAGEDLDPDRQDRFELVPGLPRLRQEAVRNAAVSAQPGRPLVVFSHGHGGHRRQSTFLTTHLASHGLVVAAPDHPGNTMRDVMRAAMAERSGERAADAASSIRRLVVTRPDDVDVVLGAFTSADDALPLAAEADRSPLVDLRRAVDRERIGICGHSFGGWTALMAADRDPRLRAVVALAPAGGESRLDPGDLQRALRFTRDPAADTLVIAADGDSLLPLIGIEAMVARMRPPRRLVVLERTDHMHFCDRAEQVHEMFRAMPPPGGFRAVADQTPPFTALRPAADVVLAVRGLTLAQFTAPDRVPALAGALASLGVRLVP